jgi:hyperosmotically inducible periplasmic protein
MSSVRFKLAGSTWLSSAALAAALLSPGVSPTQGQTAPSATVSPDNSRTNKAQHNTADQQSEAASDRLLTKTIRQALIADKSLSTYGHNVKIITKDGSVTLKGPVHSEEEKQSIVSKTESIVGSPDTVTNQLTVKQ